MSRVASNPISIPAGVEFNVQGQLVKVKGPKGALEFHIHEQVEICRADDGTFTFKVRKLHTSANYRPRGGQSRDEADALTGTMRALVNNMVNGVTKGFERKLTLIGVGYRALLKGRKLELTLGFSHPVAFDVPEGITIEVPVVTEIIVKGVDKQLVGQVAAKIRAYRPPEPYKGKGIRYADEEISLKETKK